LEIIGLLILTVQKSRSEEDPKHYVTTYGNSFLIKKSELPTLHPGITATRNQWIHSRMQK